MRSILAIVFFASFASAQTPEIDAAVKAKLATLKFLGGLYDAESGGYRNEPMAKPSLRATNAAVKATKYLGGKLDDKEKTAKFVLGCYDDKTGAFAEPGGKPDVTTTCIGIMAAGELGIEKEKYKRSMEHIHANAKSFDEMRIGAAAVEAWGVKDCPFELKPWIDAAKAVLTKRIFEDKEVATVTARDIGSASAFIIRLGEKIDTVSASNTLSNGQLHDGGWGIVVTGQVGELKSDMETTYRVVRAFTLMPGAVKIKGFKSLREFIAKHRNEDGGYATKLGEKSSAAGTYYAVIITKWLDELEKK